MLTNKYLNNILQIDLINYLNIPIIIQKHEFDNSKWIVFYTFQKLKKYNYNKSLLFYVFQKLKKNMYNFKTKCLNRYCINCMFNCG
jgi:hypothetical protein